MSWEPIKMEDKLLENSNLLRKTFLFPEEIVVIMLDLKISLGTTIFLGISLVFYLPGAYGQLPPQCTFAEAIGIEEICNKLELKELMKDAMKEALNETNSGIMK